MVRLNPRDCYLYSRMDTNLLWRDLIFIVDILYDNRFSVRTVRMIRGAMLLFMEWRMKVVFLFRHNEKKTKC